MLSDTRPIASPGIQLIQLNPPGATAKPKLKWIRQAAVIAGVALILGIMIWQAFTAQGNPDPSKDQGRVRAVIDTGILVFREGLEAVLVLSVLTASLRRGGEGHWKPVAFGAGASFMACIGTWFAVVALITYMNFPQLQVQAVTGLLAIGVLLVIMNWFFHNMYWTGWITHHNRRKQELLETPGRSQTAIFGWLAMIGFTAVYREGFELVVFLQSVREQWGSHIVLEGFLVGLALTSIVAILTFVLDCRLPYKRMLVLTGIMLGTVLVVMVGENIQEMQAYQQGVDWLPAAPIGHITMPAWMSIWFAVYPDYISLGAQALTILIVVGSFFLARRGCARIHSGAPSTATCIVPDCNNCSVSHADNPAASGDSACDGK